MKNQHGFRFPLSGGSFRLYLTFPLLFLFSFSDAQHAVKGNPAEGKTQNRTWTSDNGNGTFTNPLFYDEFSDPDLIRVGDDYYLTGTTMHAMPGLPVLHSKDLVNWEFLTYVCDRLDLGPEFRLEDDKEIYGQGIWAPSIRYHKGTYYIFTNVNRYGTQVYTATNPAGPWKHHKLNASLHDLSVLFDDDGKIYAIWGYNEIRMVELKPDVSGIIPETEKIIIPKDQGAGEGSHFYKIDGKYYITLTNYDPLCYQVTARADKPDGPYEITVTSAEENMGVATTYRLGRSRPETPFEVLTSDKNFVGSIPMHQGGLVQTQTGEWWGFSMMDFNSVGRTLNLSPVTWQDGWPYFGLSGNLTRSPKTWVKPNTGFTSEPHAPYERSDDFSAGILKPVWQWNHAPVDAQWSLTKRKGYLRLNALPAKNFWQAKNSITQRAIGPQSVATAEVDLQGLKVGDAAGLALLNLPYSWIGVAKTASGLELQQFDQRTDKVAKVADIFKDNNPKGKAAKNKPVTLWLRASCNFDTDKAAFSYSTDGTNFQNLGEEYIMVYQLKTFQGVRFALFNYNTSGTNGGFADFNSFEVYEPQPGGLTQSIPYGKTIQFTSLGDSTVLVNWRGFLRPVFANDRLASGNASHFQVIDKGNGRIALKSISNGGYVTVKGLGLMADIRIEPEDQGEASTFQWQDMMRGDLMLMSLKTHRYLFADPNARSLTSADAPGTRPDRKDGVCFSWKIVGE